jgi:hypothetical protein
MGVGDGIRRGHYSTANLPANQRHDAWSERGWPSIAAVFSSTPIGPFSTSAEDFDLDGIAVSYTSGTARLLERTPERIDADGLDLLGIGLLLDGEMEGTAASREFQASAGEILLFDLSQPITMTMSASDSIQVALTRPLAEAHFGPLTRLHGAIAPGDAARSFRDHLLALRDTLRHAGAVEAPGLAQALIASLAQALRAAGLIVSY